MQSVSRLTKASWISIGKSYRQLSSNFLIPGDDEAFQKIESSTAKKVYYFTASWCPPCKMIAPRFEAISKETKSIHFVKIDVDNLPDAARLFSIRSVPTFIFKMGSKEIAKFSGAAEEELRRHVDELDKASQ